MLKAIIFDCDGIIADTEPLHLSTLQQSLRQEGIVLTTEDYYAQYLALDDRGCYKLVYQRNGLELTEAKLSELMRRKAESIEPIMRRELTVFPGVPDFIRTASKRLPLAVASGALRGEIDLILDHAGVSSYFEAIVSAEDVTRGKPDPESFLKALSLINGRRDNTIDPAECLVIEDSLHGVQAARMARMRCLAVTNSYDRSRLSQADIITSSLADITLSQIEIVFEY